MNWYLFWPGELVFVGGVVLFCAHLTSVILGAERAWRLIAPAIIVIGGALMIAAS